MRFSIVRIRTIVKKILSVNIIKFMGQANRVKVFIDFFTVIAYNISEQEHLLHLSALLL